VLDPAGPAGEVDAGCSAFEGFPRVNLVLLARTHRVLVPEVSHAASPPVRAFHSASPSSKAPDKSGPVFASLSGGRLAHRNVERRGFDAAAEAAGIEGVTHHDLRHAYGSRLASKGLSARQIADAIGHKKTSTTEIYIQRFNGEAADERVREAMSG
jgi:site-specific recombinase XerD